ncbi:MAG TPA: MOSC domain-containing protein [Elusimicrobia bacterium]|nr:MOSC domain-containing protein [Elusimicrobiota bacterium]
METIKGKVISINISEKKGTVKKPVKMACVKENFGIVGDAHSGSGRQVSFIGWDAVENWLKKKSKKIKINYGDFAQNITTDGIDWNKAKVGDKIKIFSPKSEVRSPKSILEITQIGKECHSGCAIRKAVGDCIMPKQGIFAKVLNGGEIKIGDTIESGSKKKND